MISIPPFPEKRREMVIITGSYLETEKCSCWMRRLRTNVAQNELQVSRTLNFPQVLS